MRLLYVIAKYGADNTGNLIHRELGQELIQYGHTFDVFAFASARDPLVSPAVTVEQGIRVKRAISAGTLTTDALNAAAKPFLHYDRFAPGAWALRNFLRRQPRYDIVLAEGAYPFGAMCALAGASRTLLVTVAGGDFIDSRAANYGYGRFRTARALMGYTFRHAAAVRVTTPLVEQRAVALGAPREKLALIPRNIASYCYPPPGTDLEAFRRAARAELQNKYAPGEGKIIAAVGRLLPIKGFDILLRALAPLSAKIGKTHLLLVGPNRIDPQFGDYQAYLTQLAAALGVAESVSCTGAVEHPQVRALLAGADAIAVPSILEGMNKVAVEGAAVGTPSVVTRSSGIADLLRAADAGEIVPENSPEALADGLARVLGDAQVRSRYVANGLEFAAQFSSARVGAALNELCEKIAAQAD